MPLLPERDVCADAEEIEAEQPAPPITPEPPDGNGAWYTQAEVDTAIASSIITLKCMAARSTGHVDMESSESYAMRGALKSLHTFDPTKGVRFSTYASVCARNAILEGWRSEDHLTRTRRERVRASGVQSGADLPPLSLDEVVAGTVDGQSVRLSDAIPDEADMEVGAISSSEAAYVNNLARCLDVAEAMVIRLIYFRDMNRTDIGTLMKISKASVSRIERRALLKMRHAALADPHCPLLDDIQDDPDLPLFGWTG